MTIIHNIIPRENIFVVCYDILLQSTEEMKHQNSTHQIHLSASVIVKALAFFALAVFLWFIRDILVLFFIALLLAALVDPLAHWFEKKHIPRGAAVLLIYLFIAAAVAVFTFLVIPPLVSELSGVARGLGDSSGNIHSSVANLQTLIDRSGFPADLSSVVSVVNREIANLFTNLFAVIGGVVGNILTLLVVLILAYYLVVEEQEGKRFLRQVTPRRYHAYLLGLFRRMQERLGLWLRGQLLLMLAIGLMTYVGLSLFHIPYALALAVLAGLLEFVPYAGPMIAAVPAVVVAFTVSPEKALAVLILCFIIQQLENAVLVPKIMEREVGLNPVVSLFALMVGYTLAGVGGAILAIPFTAALLVFLNDMWGDQ